MAGKRRQGGMSIITLIFILAVLAGVGAIAMKALPSFLEYQAILKAVERAKGEPTPAAIRETFNRSAQVDNVSAIEGKDLQIAKEGEQTVVSFAYQKEFHMFGPAWLLLKYEGQSRPGR